MFQVQADWTMWGSIERIEEELMTQGDKGLTSFKFLGPGFYLTKTDTVLIVPDGPLEPEKVWSKPQTNKPNDQSYRVYVYNCLFADTIFAHCAVAPVRVDER